MVNKLMYPIAKHKATGKLVNAKDAPNGKSCECIWYHCNQDMIAINNITKQRPHFRHDSDSESAGSYESYIHWLAKEAIKEIGHIRSISRAIKKSLSDRFLCSAQLLQSSAKNSTPIEMVMLVVI